eukprot:TRINITY_DN29658_c0_g1_i1.p1 TRINITY_DN29658_c0_g1~~TRINITY_DN29658_c0_g1_i1.p1  ORF type:complete len:101 (+),score=5.64 TRINITY_DN29658_c0_g1_i1:42-305(+)
MPVLLLMATNGDNVTFHAKTHPSAPRTARDLLQKLSHHTDVEAWAIGDPSPHAASAVAYQDLDAYPPRSVDSIATTAEQLMGKYIDE